MRTVVALFPFLLAVACTPTRGETEHVEANQESPASAAAASNFEAVPPPPPAHSKDEQPELTPRERDRRGDEHLFAGRFAEAVADFDAFLTAEPQYDAYHWRRGIAYYYAGEYAKGAAQFVRHRTVNPNDVENAAWHFLCLAREKDAATAREALLPVGPDQRDPMQEVYEFYAGRATPKDVLARGASSPQRDAMFFAHLYLGLYFEVTGDPQQARKHMDLAATKHRRDHYMGRVARIHAKLLADD